MRILYSSNAPWVNTGYGIQTRITVKNLKRMGHKVACHAFWGLMGSELTWNGIKVYPDDAQDWGIKQCRMWYDDFKADVYMTHVDIWVLKGLPPDINWVPRFPIDHEPVPPLILDVVKNHPAIVRPVVESRHAQRMLADEGIEADYIPLAVDTEVFKPLPEKRQKFRERYGWQDKFVIGTVATNHGERKNWICAMKAVKVFQSMHPGEVIYYMHTNPIDPRGINILALREMLDMKSYSFHPSQLALKKGIDQATLANTYNVMDVFLLPTKGEGTGVPLIEAQSCGVPLITTKCTGHEEVMGGGWFVEKLDPIWTGQNAWQFEARTEEVLEKLEMAYKAWKTDGIKEQQYKARKRAMFYDETRVFKEVWPPFMEDLKKRLKGARNREGIQPWRVNLIPATCVPKKVLDIGCGVNQPYRKVLEKLGDYVGVDKRGGDGIYQADAHKLPFSDGEFGFVWSSELLEHVKNPGKVVAEAKRVGRHGVITFSTPLNPYFKLDPDHKVIKDVEYTVLGSGDGMIVW